MSSFILHPGESRTVDTREGGDTLSVTNNNGAGVGSFTVSIDGGQAQPVVLQPGTSWNGSLAGRREATLTNTGNLALEVDFE